MDSLALSSSMMKIKAFWWKRLALEQDHLEQLTKLYNEAQAHLSRLDTRLTGGEDVGEDTGENAAAPLSECKPSRPKPPNRKPFEIPLRRFLLELGRELVQRHSTISHYLYLALEAHGATTGKEFVPKASNSVFDLVAKDGVVGNKGRTDRVGFCFYCLSQHHGTTDTEYLLSAVVSDRVRTLGRQTHSKWSDNVHHVDRGKCIASPAALTASSMVETSRDSEETHANPFNARVSDGSSSGTSASDSRCSVRVQPPSTYEQPPLSDPFASIPRANEGSEPEWQPPARRKIENEDEELPVLSHVNPKQGLTSGGEEIYLVVRNLPPSVELYARFASNIAPTSHIAPGVLACRLPAAGHHGVVDVTLCQAPSVHEKAYGKSLAFFEYEANTSKAVVLLVKLFGRAFFSETMPWMQGLLPRNMQEPATSLPSSLPESAFLEILATFTSLPDFEQRLSTVNEYHQSLLHLSVHLRYRALVQSLVDWGIDLNIKDVNGLTALHTAYLCGEASVAHMLEQRGAIQLSLDGLGRPLVELKTDRIIDHFCDDFDAKPLGPSSNAPKEPPRVT